MLKTNNPGSIITYDRMHSLNIFFNSCNKDINANKE